MTKRASQELPQAYEFDYEWGISAHEVVDLRARSEWGTEKNLETWEACLRNSIATVGVRSPIHELVGIGFLAGNPRHAVLCDFNVDPKYQGKGIGKAILRRRIEIADQKNIPYLYTELSPTNILRTLYEELGFQANGNVYSRASRRHPSELAI